MKTAPIKHELIGPPVDAPVLPEGYVYDVSLRIPQNGGYNLPHKRYWRVLVLKQSKQGWFIGTTYREVGRSGVTKFDKIDLIDPRHLRQACERAFDDMETKELVKLIQKKYEGLQSGQ